MKPLLSIFLLLFAALVHADDARPALHQERGPAKLTLTVDRLQPEPVVRLSTLIVMTIEVSDSSPLDVELQEPLGPAVSWQIVEKPSPKVTDDAKHWSQRWVLLPTHPGDKVPLKPPTLRYRTGKSEWMTVSWDALELKVLTRIGKVDETQPHDITSIEELPAEKPSLAWLLWIVLPLILLAGLALAFFIVMVARNRPARPKLAPADRARRNLARLAKGQPKTPHAYQHLHFLLARVLRRFVQAQWGLPALRLTTPEFLVKVEEAKLFSPEQQTQLGELLAQCDLAKFCPAPPDADAFARQLQNARAFIDACVPQANAEA